MAKITFYAILDKINFKRYGEKENIINEIHQLSAELWELRKRITIAKRSLRAVIAEKNAYCEKLIAGAKKGNLPMYNGICHSLPAYLKDIVDKKEYIARCQQMSKSRRAAIRQIILALKPRMCDVGDIVGLPKVKPEVKKDDGRIYVEFTRGQAFELLNRLANGIKSNPKFVSVSLDFPKSAVKRGI